MRTRSAPSKSGAAPNSPGCSASHLLFMKVAVLPGDGVGPEVIAEAVKVLAALRRDGSAFEMEQASVGGAAYDASGDPLPGPTLELARKADAILFGAVGGPRYDALPREKRPEQAILRLRKELNLFANLRPATVFPELADASQLWREVVGTVGKEYAAVELTHMYVDNAAMQLLKNPRQFDVIVTGNMFGDILSDEASMLTGSIGMLPSASLDEKGKGLYEPIHGSAPDIAGRDIANPLAAILSAAMMLRYSLDQDAAAARVEAAVRKVLAQGYRTGDIFQSGTRKVGTREMGDAVVAALGRHSFS